MTGLHKSICLSFLIVGHTKFSPDWCFGLLKRKFKRTAVNSLEDLVTVVDQSAVVNKAQLVGSQSGEVIVPSYDWAEYLGPHFHKIPSIKTQHHFHFSSSRPGEVTVKQLGDSEEVCHHILRDTTWKPRVEELPSTVVPKGLSIERRWYLYQKIREFCSPDTRDQVCPYPGPGPCPPCPPCPPSPISLGLTGAVPPSPLSLCTRKRRTCGQCGEQGHNSRSCKKQKVKENKSNNRKSNMFIFS